MRDSIYSKSVLILDSTNFGIWSRIDSTIDDGLKRNSKTLPQLIENAFANSTLKKYKPAWTKWLEWYSNYEEVSPCPADPLHVALYINDSVIKDQKALILLILLGFSGFTRISELLPLKVKHVNFTESGIKIHIEKSKVDQLREGNTVFVSRLESNNCPVYWLNRYLDLSFLKGNTENYIFFENGQDKKRPQDKRHTFHIIHNRFGFLEKVPPRRPTFHRHSFTLFGRSLGSS